MILLIGSTGFVGKNLSLFFQKKKIKYTGVSSKDFDLKDLGQTKSIIKKTNPKIIINAAAKVGGLNFNINNNLNIYKMNKDFFYNLYESCKSFENIKIINLISNCAFPGNTSLYIENNFFNGDVHPSVYAYGHIKREGVFLSNIYRKELNLDIINLFIPNMFGKFEHFDDSRSHALCGLIKRMHRSKINNDSEFVVYGTGKPIREWLYIDDFIKVINLILNNNYNFNELNIAQNHGISILELTKKIAKIMNYKGIIKIDRSYQDGAKIKIMSNKKFIKYFPKFKFTNFDKSLNDTIKWYIANVSKS